MDLQLQDKVFIVTGGGAGIGGAISLTLAEEGAIPVIFGRSALKEDFQAALSERTSDFAFYQVDVTDEAAVASAIAATAERFGRIDGVVNNAGANDNVGLDASVDAFRASLETKAGMGATAEDLRLHVEAVWQLFGAERLLWGSDWPVSRLTHSHAEVRGHMQTLTHNWTADERAALFEGTAQRIYQLKHTEQTQRTSNGFATAR